MPRLVHLHEALCQHLPRSGSRSTCQNLCLWPAVERRTEKYRIDCVSFWPVRLPLQGCIGWAEWDDAPLRRCVGQPSEHALGPRRWGVGVRSLGMSQVRPGVGGCGPSVVWCLGKVDNCQVAIYLGYVSSKGHSLVDTRLYLPKEWTKDTGAPGQSGGAQSVPACVRVTSWPWRCWRKTVPRCRMAGLPGDDEMGRPYGFRRRLAPWGAIPVGSAANTAMRDLEVEPPGASGRGRRPRVLGNASRPGVRTLEEAAWQRIDGRDGRQRAAGGRGRQTSCGVQNPSASARR